ncbi:hypothetical protein Zmor_021277 [Zophobas morio]|uniref:Uncharacterized protein n=1 Tax=Zophobas morio TaxID=2755281 RepID=A0AA38MB73_9CUCU|nr:hypothetical protein Zmor_021277 [Zophobas morio]
MTAHLPGLVRLAQLALGLGLGPAMTSQITCRKREMLSCMLAGRFGFGFWFGSVPVLGNDRMDFKSRKFGRRRADGCRMARKNYGY